MSSTSTLSKTTILSQGLMQAYQVHAAGKEADFQHKLLKLRAAANERLVMKDYQTGLEQRRFQRLQVGQAKQRAILEAEKARIRAIGSIAVEAGTTGRLGNAIDNVILDLHRDIDTAKTDAEAQFRADVQKTVLTGDDAVNRLHESLLGNIIPLGGADNAAQMMQYLAVGLQTYNNYQEAETQGNQRLSSASQ